MISRRSLLASWLGSYLLLAGEAGWALGVRKPKVKVEPVIGGPRTLSRQEWPPAISPEYIGIVDKGYACFADDVGRLAIVDLKREDNPQVMGELFGIGRKVVATAITLHRAIAVVQVESGADTIYQLVIASLTPANEITIMSRTVLSNFSEPTCVASFGDVIAIGGTGLNTENQIALYSMGKGKKTVDPVLVANLLLEHSPFKIDIFDRQLLALCGPDSTELVLVSIANPRAPEAIKSLRLDGAFPIVARTREQIMVAGMGFDKRYQAKIITLKPAPAVAGSVALPAVTELLDIGAQKGQFLILANQGSRQVVVPVIVARKNALTVGNAVLLPAGGKGASPRAHIAVTLKDAYIATDWGGVQVLNVTKAGWQFSYSHTIPRLPASAVVFDGSFAVIACAELKLYNLTDPKHPVLVDSTDISSTVRAMLSLGRTFACLNKDNLTIRSTNKPGELIASVKANGSALAYDQSRSVAYVIRNTDKGCALALYRATEDSLKAGTSIELAVPCRKALAQSGKLLLAGLSELNLYKMDDLAPQLLGSRKLPNFAIRDFVMVGDMIYLSCVDENLKGAIVALNGAKDDLGIVGACDLPVDAGALAVSNGKAVVLGRSKTGKDMVALVSVQDPAQLKLLESFETLEAASAVTIRDKIAIIAGRGLELIDIS